MAKNAFRIIFSGLMETIHVELSNETVDFLVTEVSREDNFLKFVGILYHKIFAWRAPEYYLTKFLILNNKKNTLRISKVFPTKPATYTSCWDSSDWDILSYFLFILY